MVSFMCSEVQLLSCARLFSTPWIVACTKLLGPWDFRGKSTGVGCHFLLQGIFPTQGLNPGLSHCRQTLYHLSHQESNLPRLKKKKKRGKKVELSLAGQRSQRFKAWGVNVPLLASIWRGPHGKEYRQLLGAKHHPWLTASKEMESQTYSDKEPNSANNKNETECGFSPRASR